MARWFHRLKISTRFGNGYLTEIANDGTTGTTVHQLAKLTILGYALTPTTVGDSDGMIGIVVGESAGGTTGVITGNAQIAIDGQATCTFENATTKGDFVTIGRQRRAIAAMRARLVPLHRKR